MHPRTSARVVLLGILLMGLGALDPLEGSVLIAAGAALPAVVAWHLGASLRWAAGVASALVIVGVAALFAISAVGGVGGPGGRSYWWLLLAAPYPVGWVLALITAVRLWRALRAPADLRAVR